MRFHFLSSHTVGEPTHVANGDATADMHLHTVVVFRVTVPAFHEKVHVRILVVDDFSVVLEGIGARDGALIELVLGDTAHEALIVRLMHLLHFLFTQFSKRVDDNAKEDVKASRQQSAQTKRPDKAAR